jgi:hypothetical protein
MGVAVTVGVEGASAARVGLWVGVRVGGGTAVAVGSAGAMSARRCTPAQEASPAPSAATSPWRRNCLLVSLVFIPIRSSGCVPHSKKPFAHLQQKVLPLWQASPRRWEARTARLCDAMLGQADRAGLAAALEGAPLQGVPNHVRIIPQEVSRDKHAGAQGARWGLR